jgi:hypothetical protein
MKLLPALTDSTVRRCLTWGGCGPMNISQYAWLFSVEAARTVTIHEALDIISHHNYREWVREGCPPRLTYADIERTVHNFFSSRVIT